MDQREGLAGGGASDAPEWSYYDGSGPRGPFTLRAIGQMARAGVVGPDVPVARVGDGAWRPLSEVTGRPPECRAPAVLPEEEAGGTVFRVHLGGLRVPSSRMGFAWAGTLRLGDDGTMTVGGWKLWRKGRILGALASLLVVVPPVVWAIGWVIGFPGGFIAGAIGRQIPETVRDFSTMAERVEIAVAAERLTMMRDYVLGATGWLIAGFALIAAIAIPLFVASRCVVRRGSDTFSIPDGAVVSRKKATVTMPLADGGGRLIRAARITFTSEAEAGRFVGAITGDPGQGQAV